MIVQNSNGTNIPKDRALHCFLNDQNRSTNKEVV